MVASVKSVNDIVTETTEFNTSVALLLFFMIRKQSRLFLLPKR